MAGKDDIKIRPMERRDILPTLAIFKKVTRGQSSLTYRDLANSDLGGALDLSLVAELEDKIVGFVLARLAYVGVPLILSAHIQSVVVDPDYQRQRIAARLMDSVLDRCRDEQVSEVGTVLDERDWELGNFFENLGFRRAKSIAYTKYFKTKKG